MVVGFGILCFVYMNDDDADDVDGDDGDDGGIDEHGKDGKRKCRDGYGHG